MMTLTDGLPNAITVNGKSYLLNTDFRVWMNFPSCEDFRVLFQGNYPCFEYEGKWAISKNTYSLLAEFFTNSCPVPKNSGHDENVLDFIVDSELIYAAFMQQYGIDLFESTMHWHKFKALLKGLTDQTLLGQVMGWRGSTQKEFSKLREAWELPVELTDEEQNKLDEFNRLWG